MIETGTRFRLYGCDFLVQRAKKGWNVYVRKALEGERTLVGNKNNSRSATAFAINWAHAERMRENKKLPSQLMETGKPRPKIVEEE